MLRTLIDQLTGKRFGPRRTRQRHSRRIAFHRSLSRGLQVESLEERNLLASVFNAGAEASNFRLSLDSTGQTVQITQDGAPAVEYVLASLTELTINGNSLDNTLTVDLGNGNPIPAGGLFYNGGDQATEIGDAIQIVGGDSFDTSYTPTIGSDGIITLTPRGASASESTTIYFTSLEPVLDSAIATNLIVDGTPTGNAISYINGPGGGIFAGDTGLVTIDSFETYEFDSKQNLILQSFEGDDVVTLNAPLTPTGLTRVTVNGGDDNDVVNLLAANVQNLTIDGNAGNDTARVAGAAPGVFDSGNIVFLNTAAEFDLGGTTPGTGAGFHDLLNVIGTVTLGGNVTLAARAFDDGTGVNFVPTVGDQFVIINNDGTDAVTGVFAGLPDNSVFDLGNQVFRISYDFDSATGVDGVGNDVALFAFGTAETDVSIDASGNLVITDVNGGISDDRLIIQSDTTNNQFIISDPLLALTTRVPAALRPAVNTVVVPFADVTGSAVIIDARDGDDTLTVNFSDGDFARAITFNGGGQGSFGDSLVLTGGGTIDTVTHQFDNANDGTIDITGNQTITYTGLEPINDNLDADNRVFQFTDATAGGETITLSDAGGLVGFSRIDSTAGESVTFINPNVSLTVRTAVLGGAGTDTVNIEGVDSTFDADLTIETDCDDTVNFQNAGLDIGSGNLTVTTNAVSLSETISTTGSVDISACSDIDFMATGSIVASGPGAVTVTADNEPDGVGALFMADGAEIDGGTGTITLSGTEIVLARVVTANDTASAVAITSTLADLSDAGDTGGADIEATAASAIVTINTASGVGTVSEEIETEITTLDLSVTGAGGVFIVETDAIVLLDVDTGDGPITITSNGTITATDVDSSNTDDDTNDIFLGTLSGDVLVGLINAGTNNDAGIVAAGAIEESGADTTADILGGDIALVADTGIGNLGPLEIDGTRLGAITSTGDIHVHDTAGGLSIAPATADSLTVNGVFNLGAPGDDIIIRASSPLTIDGLVNNDGGGDIALAAEGNTGDADLSINANVTATGGNGNINLYAGDAIDIDAAVIISTAASGAILASASTDFAGGTPTNGFLPAAAGDGDVVMNSGSTIAAGGDATVRGAGDIDLSLIFGDTVVVTADFDGVGGGLSDDTGEITDNRAGEAANVTASVGIAFRAASGIGDADDINTATSLLAASNTTAGNIQISNNGPLTIGTVAGLAGVSGGVSISAPGTITVDEPISATGVGAVSLSARGANTFDVVVNNTITTQEGSITIDADHHVTGIIGADIATNSGIVSLRASLVGPIAFGELRYCGNIAYGAGELRVQSSQNSSIGNLMDCDGVISGSGDLIKGADPQLELFAANTYTGETHILDGFIVARNNNALGATSAGTIVQNDTSLIIFNNLTIAEPVTLNGTGHPGLFGASFQLRDGALHTGAITLATDTQIRFEDASEIAGPIGESGGSRAVTFEAASGALSQAVLSSNNHTYTGPTIVTGDGTLFVTGSTPAASTVTVEPTATLGGTGTIGAPLIVQGTLAPGLSPGILNTGDVDFQNDSMFQVELGGTTPGNGAGFHDQLNVTGTVTIGVNVALDTSLFDSFVPTAGDQFVIINNDGADAVTGMFAGLPDGAVFELGNQVFTISYDFDSATGTDGTGNDVVLSAFGAAETDISIDASGNLVITDINGGVSNDLLTIQSDTTNNQFIISDPLIALTTRIPAALRPDGNTVIVPFADVTGSEIVIDTLGGDDVLTVDFTAGNFAKTMTFNGGESASDNDQLTLTGGGTFAIATYNFNNVISGDLDNGTIDITGNQTITYTGLEPIMSTITATDVTLNYSTATETLTVTDAGSGQTQVTSDVAAETVVFNNPTGTLTINAGDTGDDTININSLSASYPANVVIDGEAPSGADIVNINNTLSLSADKSLTVTADTINLPNAASDVSTSGAGTVSLTADLNIDMDSGSSITTGDGNITLLANAAGNTGDFVGIDLDDADIMTTSGTISLTGTGGDTLGNHGVLAQNTSSIGSGVGAATVTIMGTGGDGVRLSSSPVTAVSAAVSITGVSAGAVGVRISSPVMTTGTAASITIMGTSSSSNATGVILTGPVSTLGDNATVAITGNTTGDDGVQIAADVTTSGSAASIMIMGTTTSNLGASSDGVLVAGSGTQIASAGGAISITGTTVGGGTAGDGVEVSAGVTLAINATNAATITITGTGDGSEAGVQIDSPISSETGTVTITSLDGDSTTDDIQFGADGDITSTSGTITIDAKNAGGTADVFMADGALIDAGSGLIIVVADVDVTLGGLLTSGEVQVTACDGAIIDGGDTDLDITASAAALRAATGIGANPLDTAISTLAASNSTSGDIMISNAVGGLLTIGTVDGLAGVTNGPPSPGSVNIQNNSPLTVASDVMAAGGITLTAFDTAVANMTDNLTVNAGVSVTSTAGTIDLNAGDDVTLTATSVVSAATSSIFITVDIPFLDPDTGPNDPLGGSTVTLGDSSVLVAAGGTIITGGDDPDTFNLVPQTASTISLDGGDPTTKPGDVLNLVATGLTATLTLVPNSTGFSGTLAAAGVGDIDFADIETVLPTGALIDLIIDNSAGDMAGDALADTTTIAMSGANLVITVDDGTNAPCIAVALGDGVTMGINSVEVLGSADDDILLIDDAGGLPTFPGTAANAFSNTSHTFEIGSNVGVHFDGDGGVNSMGFDLNTLARTVLYYAGEDVGAGAAANNGNVAIFGDFSLSFENLKPLDFLGAGALSTLVVDATVLPGSTFLTVDDDINVPAGFLPFDPLFGAAAADDGVTAIWGDGGFETTRFGNFGSVTVRGGTGSQTLTLTALDMGVAGPLDPLLPGPNPITAITLDGENTTVTDSAADTINILSVPAAVTALVLGGGGSDTINISSDAPTNMGNLDGILGAVLINGEAHDPGLPMVESVTAKTSTVTVSIDMGDVLNISDAGSAMANAYTLTGSTFARTAAIATGTITFLAIETLNIETGTLANDIDIISTPAASKTTVTSQGAADDIDVTTTGSGSILIINAAGGADAVDIATTGATSVTIVNGGDGMDTLTQVTSGAGSGVALNGQGDADTITIQNAGATSSSLATGGSDNDTLALWNLPASSFAQLDGDDGSDTINLGTPANVVSGILGQVLVNGGSHLAAPTMTESVTAKGNTVTRTLPVGDILNINDQAYATAAAQYNLTDMMFDRDTTVARTMYATIETINLNAGTLANDINIISTPANSKTTVTSQGTADDIDVTTTGSGSILIINAAGGADFVDIATTGATSVTIVNGGDGADTLTQVTSGASSGVAQNGQGGADTITIRNAGATSSSLATGGSDNDTLALWNLPASSFAQLDGDDGSDTINLGSPANVVSGILGQVLVNGGSHLAAPTMTESVTAKGNTVTRTLPVGDILNINDQAYAAAAQYNLTDMMFDRDTTVARTMYATIETINLNAGTLANDINLISTPANSKTTVTSQDAADDIDITTTGAGSILIINAAGGADAVDIATTGATSVTIVNGGDGADTLTQVTSGASSGVALHGQGDADTITIQNAGANAKTAINGDAGSDLVNVSATGTGGFMDINGGDDNDTFNLLTANVQDLTIDGNAGNNSARIAGATPGTFDSGNIVFLNTTVEVEIGGTMPGNGAGFHDQLNVTGTVTIENNATLNVLPFGGFVPSAGDPFVIINNDDADAVSGTFAGLPNGANFTAASGDVYRITYFGGDGNDVVLEAGLLDFGDAPASYPVTFTEDGARHVPTGPRLGPDRDAEVDGVHSANADADDLALPDDEDGVVFAGTLQGSTLAATMGSVDIDLQNADPVGDNRLDAWIDFNRNGNWNDPGEQIFSGFDLGGIDGVQTLMFTIPQSLGGNFVSGTTVARFRISSSGGLLPTGAAADGEVEDHLVQLNTLPIATDNSYTTDEDTPLPAPSNVITDNSGVGIDSDADGDSLVISAINGQPGNVGVQITLASGALLTTNAVGDFNYDPNGQFDALGSGDVATDSFTYTISDPNGGSDTATAFIQVTSVNDPPVAFDVSLAAIEDGPAVIADFNGDDIDNDDNQASLTYSIVTPPSEGNVTNNNNATFTFDPGTDFQDLPDGQCRDVTFTYEAIDLHTAVSNLATVTVTVCGVNDPPTFVLDGDVVVSEDAPGQQTIPAHALAIDDGVGDVGQALTFDLAIVGTTGNLAFDVDPAIIATTGDLTFTVAANTNGQATIEVTLMDDGGTANGGVDTSLPQTFTITVNAVNDAPAITLAGNQTVDEDAGQQTVNPFATNFLPGGGADEVGQVIDDFIISNDNNGLFSVQPDIDNNGTLTYTPADNVNGTAVVTAQVRDDGGTANGGVDTSLPLTFTITVNAVNDAPAITLAGDQSVAVGAGAQTVPNFASGFQAGGGADESTQAIDDFIVTNDNNGLFSVQPDIANNGTLSYTPTVDANGCASVTAQVRDDGGTANGGGDASAPQTFKICVVTTTVQSPTPSLLTIADTFPGGKRDRITLRIQGSNFVITDRTNIIGDFTDGETGTQVRVPLGSISNIEIDLLGGNDRVLIDFRNAPPGFNPSVTVKGGRGHDTLTFAGTNSLRSVVVSAANRVENIFVNGPITTQGGPVTLNALRRLQVNADIDVGAGAFHLTARRDIFGDCSLISGATGTIEGRTGIGGVRVEVTRDVTMTSVRGGIAGCGTNTVVVARKATLVARTSIGTALVKGGQVTGVVHLQTKIDRLAATARGVGIFIVNDGPFKHLRAKATNPGGFPYGIIDITPSTALNSRATLTDSRAAGNPNGEASPWQNALNHFDVNNDGSVSALDALVGINFLNAGRQLEAEGESDSMPYVDVNGDRAASALDILMIVNYLNAQATHHAEGESAGGDHNPAANIHVERLFGSELSLASSAFGNQSGPRVGESVPTAQRAGESLVTPLIAQASSQPSIRHSRAMLAGDEASQDADSQDGESQDWESLLDEIATDAAEALFAKI